MGADFEAHSLEPARKPTDRQTDISTLYTVHGLNVALTSVDTDVSLELAVVAEADLAVRAAVLLGAGLALRVC